MSSCNEIAIVFFARKYSISHGQKKDAPRTVCRLLIVEYFCRLLEVCIATAWDMEWNRIGDAVKMEACRLLMGDWRINTCECLTVDHRTFRDIIVCLQWGHKFRCKQLDRWYFLRNQVLSAPTFVMRLQYFYQPSKGGYIYTFNVAAQLPRSG